MHEFPKNIPMVLILEPGTKIGAPSAAPVRPCSRGPSGSVYDVRLYFAVLEMTICVCAMTRGWLCPKCGDWSIACPSYRCDRGHPASSI